MKRILVTGSRHWTDVGEIADELLQHGPGIVVHGDSRGADRIAANLARGLGWPEPEAHPAEWIRPDGSIDYGAGPRRNQEMVDLGADVCLAFPLPGSRGTWDCVRRAEAAGIEVVDCG